MKAFILANVNALNREDTPFCGYVRVAGSPIDNWGAFLLSATGPQLLALDVLPNVIGLTKVTDTEDEHWPELENTVSEDVRVKVNTWITNHKPAWPRVTETTTYGEMIDGLYKKFGGFDLNHIDVKDV